MLPLEQPDRIQIAFDDHRLVANAGPILPVTLAHHLGLGELVDNHVDLRDAPGRANVGDKLLTLVASALAGGDCIDDADTLRTGGTEQALDCVVKAPSILGAFLRSFRWGHVRQLDRVSRQLLVGAWAAGVTYPTKSPIGIPPPSIRISMSSSSGSPTSCHPTFAGEVRRWRLSRLPGIGRRHNLLYADPWHRWDNPSRPKSHGMFHDSGATNDQAGHSGGQFRARRRAFSWSCLRSGTSISS